MRRSRCSTWASASSFSRSWRAIRRSTASPVTRNSPAPIRSTANARPAAGRKTWNSATSSSPAAASTGSAGGTRWSRSRPQLVEPLAGRRRRDDHRHVAEPRRRPRRADGRGGRVLLGHEVGLRQREDARQLGQPRVVLGQLALDHRVVRDRVGAVERREVEHVHEQPRALDVGEEVVAEAGAVARALDQAGDVGDDELAIVALERPEHRLDRRERVRRHLRLRAREPRQQRRLAGVGEPDEADVGEQLEVQLDAALLARQALLGQPRRLPHRRLEARVAAPPGAAARDRDLLAGTHEVEPRAVPALDLGAGRHRDDQRLAVRAVALGALAVAAALGAEVHAPAEGLEVAQRVVAAQHDVAAAAAVAAVGPALGHVRLAAEGQGAVAAGARANLQYGTIGEHPVVSSPKAGDEGAPPGRRNLNPWTRSSSSPVPRPASAPPPPATPPRPDTASSSPPAARTSCRRSPTRPAASPSAAT